MAREAEFVDVETPQADGDIDSEMTGPGTDLDNSSSSSGLELHRMSANNSHPFAQGMGMGMGMSMDDDDEDSSPLHPLMSRLQNRLLSRNTNINRASSSKFDSLHPYTSILSLADVDQCVELENSAFPENERCSREKVCPVSAPGCVSHQPSIYESRVHENVNLADVFNQDDVFDGMASLDSEDFIIPVVPLLLPCPLITTTTTIIYARRIKG